MSFTILGKFRVKDIHLAHRLPGVEVKFTGNYGETCIDFQDEAEYIKWRRLVEPGKQIMMTAYQNVNLNNLRRELQVLKEKCPELTLINQLIEERLGKQEHHKTIDEVDYHFNKGD